MSWKEFKLGELVEIKGGKRLPKGHSFVLEKTTHPYIRARDIKEGVIDIKEPVYVNSETFYKISKYIVNTGDVVMTIVGANIGDIAEIPENLEKASLTENAVKLFPINNDIIDSKFLRYSLSGENQKSKLQQVASGAAQGKLGIYKIKEFKIPLPPLPTQQKIASILSAYDDLIENNLKRIKLLEEAAQRIYKEWFVDFKFPDHENTIINPKTDLPEGWENVRLVEIANLTMGQSPKSIYYNNDSNGLPFHQGVSNYGFRYVENKTFCTKETRIAEDGDILFSVRAPVGRLNIASKKLIIGRGLCALNSKSNFQSFLFYQLKHTFFQEDMIGGGAIFNSVTKKDLENFKLIEPRDILKSKFEKIANKIDQKIKNLTFQNQNIKEARDLLLPRLMNRTIEV